MKRFWSAFSFLVVLLISVQHFPVKASSSTEIALFNYEQPLTRDCQAPPAGVEDPPHPYDLRCSIRNENELLVCAWPGKYGPTLPPQKCCSGLVLDDTDNKCKDTSIHDKTISLCTVEGDACGDGKGCFKGDHTDLFNHWTDDEVLDEKYEKNRHLVEDELVSILQAEPLENGRECRLHRECESRFCNNINTPVADYNLFQMPKGFCADRLICRLARQDEPITAGVECEPGLEKRGGKCLVDPSPYYPGLEDKVVLRLNEDLEFDPENQCRWEVDKDIREWSLKSLKVLRGMEWLFSSSSLSDRQDCLQLLPFVRDQIGKPFLKERHRLLLKFNEETHKVEKDFKKLMYAKELLDKKTPNLELLTKDQWGNPLQVHDEGLINMRDLATRFTSGYDMLKILYRRNEIWAEFEEDMHELAELTARKINKLQEPMSVTPLSSNTWKDKSSSWLIPRDDLNGFKSINGNSHSCRTSALTWLFKNNKVMKRWNHQYRVWGKNGANKSVIEGSNNVIAQTLALIGAKSVAQVKNEFTNGPAGSRGTYYLIDPLMPGDQLFFRDWGKVTWWERLWSGSNTKRRLEGNEMGTGAKTGFAQMSEAMRLRFREHYKRLRPTDDKFPVPKEEFIYEPEIATIMARNCFDKSDGPHCKTFFDMTDELAKVGFAQFWAYSAHHRDDYRSLHPNNMSWRRNLFGHYEVQIGNINHYYKYMYTHRDKQNECIEKVLKKLKQDKMDDDRKVGVGLKEGAGTNTAMATNYYDSSDYSGKGAKGGRRSRRGEASKSHRFPANPQLTTGTNSTVNDSTLLAPGGSTVTTAGGGVNTNTANAAMALHERMRAANAKAEGLGRKSEKVETTLGKVGLGNNSGLVKSDGASSAASSMQNNAADQGGGPDQLAISPEQNETGRTGNEGQASGGARAHGQGLAATGAGAGVLLDPYGSSAGADSSKGSDPTGMSNEEKDVLMANFERNRGKYNPAEDDTLFNILSKAYVRNLEKVLIKKKKIEE
jgi:hypothetical protein